MLKFGNREFRNLQEQVLKNMQNIANIKEGTAVLSEFGIKVVGEVDSLQDLPSVIDYKTAHDDWEYGDAFAIGTQPPYKLVILTRANDEITADHWFDIGDFPAPGPQGPTGPQGEVGPQGQTGETGQDGADAGFGSILATAQTLSAGSSATATVVASGPNTAKELSFTFGIPRGQDGSTSWGGITGNLADQTDLQNALNSKQDDIDASNKLPADYVSGLSTVATTGDYDDLSDKPDLSIYAESADLATVATTGAYSDLSGTPTIGAGTITIKKNGDTIDSFGVNQTADQNINITVPTKTSDLSNDSNFTSKTYVDDGLALKQDVISDLSDIRSGAAAGATAVQPAAISDMATETWVGQQGYLTSVSWSEVSDKPAFATVATSGDYDDLTNKPAIPAAQVNSDWSASSGVAQILNKPTNLVTTNTAQSITGQKSFANAYFGARANFTNGLQFDYGISHEITVKESGSASADTYNFDFPAKSGTLALTSDIPTIPTNYVTTDTAQTISGAKTFSGNQTSFITNVGSVDPVFIKAFDDEGIKFLNNGNDAYTYLRTSNISTTPAIVYLPDESGTLALTSQIPTNADYVDLTTSQTVGGTKTFIGHLTVSYDSDYDGPFTIYDTENRHGTTFEVGNLSADNVLTLPTATGTLALTSDITTVSGTNDGTNWTSLTIGSDTYGLAGGGGGGSVDWSDILNKPTFATVATSGSYNDLSDKPTIPVVDYPVTDVTVGGTSVVSNKIAAIPALFDGDYDSLTNKPDLSIYAESADLATVATTGDYDDLTNKPTIPAAQVNSDWNASSGVAQILNKPTLAAVATSGAYSDLSGTPTIPDAVSGVNDGTNWTSLTIGSTTKAIPSGGTAYSAGTWIDLSNDTISVSNPYVSLLDGNNLPRVLISNTTSGGSPSFSGAKYCNISPAGLGINDRTSNQSAQYTYYKWDRISVNNTWDLLLPWNKTGTVAVETDISTAISNQSKETWTFTLDDGQGGTTTVTKTIVLG